MATNAKPLGWYPHHVKSYRKKTGGLTTIEHGVYRLLMDEYWDRGGPLPDNARALRHATKVTHRSATSLVKILTTYFTLTDGHWHHHRIDEELAKANNRYVKRCAAAEATNAALGRDGTRYGKRPKSEASIVRSRTTVSETPAARQLQYKDKEPTTRHSPRATAALEEPIAHEVGKVASKEVVAAIVRRFTTEPSKRDNLPAIIDAAPVPAVIIEAEQQPVFEGKSLQHVREWAWSSKGPSYYHAAFDDIDKPTTNADMRALAEFTVLKAYEKAHAS